MDSPPAITSSSNVPSASQQNSSVSAGSELVNRIKVVTPAALRSFPAVKLAKNQPGISENIVDFCACCLRKTGYNSEQIAAFLNNLTPIFQEPGCNAFGTFLVCLRPFDFLYSSGFIVMLLKAVISSPAIRPFIFEAAAAADKMDSTRLSISIDNMAYLREASRLQSKYVNNPRILKQQMLNLSLGFLRVNLLDEVTPQVMRQQCQQGRRKNSIEADFLKVRLGLRILLAEKLSLPFKASPFYYEERVINTPDLALAVNYVKRTTEDFKATVAGLAKQALWRNYIDNYYPVSFELEQKTLRTPAMVISEGKYVAAKNEIVRDKEKALADFYLKKTECIVRYASPPIFTPAQML